MQGESIQLSWSKTRHNSWHRLFDLDLEAIEGEGVYVIWHGGFPSRTVKVGHGRFADAFAACRRDERVGAFAEFGTLFVTWAAADASAADGIARHLAGILRPLIEAPDADVPPVAANSPF